MTVLIGDGGHARDIAAVFPLPMIEHHSRALLRTPSRMMIGINDPATRALVAQVLGDAGWRDADPLPSSFAFYGGDAGIDIAPGCYVGPMSSLVGEVRLGRHTHIGAGCHLTRCTLGEFVTVAPGAVVCGDVTIGDRVLIGAGAVIKNLVTIGSDVTIGAGAVVVHDVPDGTTVKGVPAR